MSLNVCLTCIYLLYTTAMIDIIMYVLYGYRAFFFLLFSIFMFHFISFHFISFHFISFHFISFHFISSSTMMISASCFTSLCLSLSLCALCVLSSSFQYYVYAVDSSFFFCVFVLF